ncbi:hypothetical protein L2E82_07434 [Cichorium intybus]|uniref:Uncharacterized protein n=1 Tax=Cichorium intybus TaxID=13427 RepID=A0ACB9G4B2_CICIN|nr:hypothetical protein L2E82_07434 [Cichorium intybus]
MLILSLLCILSSIFVSDSSICDLGDVPCQSLPFHPRHIPPPPSPPSLLRFASRVENDPIGTAGNNMNIAGNVLHLDLESPPEERTDLASRVENDPIFPTIGNRCCCSRDPRIVDVTNLRNAEWIKIPETRGGRLSKGVTPLAETPSHEIQKSSTTGDLHLWLFFFYTKRHRLAS